MRNGDEDLINPKTLIDLAHGYFLWEEKCFRVIDEESSGIIQADTFTKALLVKAYHIIVKELNELQDNYRDDDGWHDTFSSLAYARRELLESIDIVDFKAREESSR